MERLHFPGSEYPTRSSVVAWFKRNGRIPPRPGWIVPEPGYWTVQADPDTTGPGGN